MKPILVLNLPALTIAQFTALADAGFDVQAEILRRLH